MDKISNSSICISYTTQNKEYRSIKKYTIALKSIDISSQKRGIETNNQIHF